MPNELIEFSVRITEININNLNTKYSPKRLTRLTVAKNRKISTKISDFLN